MGWKDAFDDAMKELTAIRQQLQRLDDPTVGLTALHGEVIQSRLKILEKIEGGVTGLREENREVRRRQDRMISDLNETRGELRELLDLVDVLRPLALAANAGDDAQMRTEETAPSAAEPGAEADYGSTDPAAAHPAVSSDTDTQGGTVENTERQPQPEDGRQEQDLALKNAIEAAYQRGTGASHAQPSGATPQASAGAENPQVGHGVLLLKAAGVASAELIAHRDTWEWLAALAVDHSHFRTPPAVEDFKEGRVRTVLSGRSLIALLIELWNTRSTATPLQGDWALAMASYNRITAELTDVAGQGETIRIVLDDGLPHEVGD